MLIKISLIHWLSRYLLIHVLSTSQILGKIASNKIKFLPSWGLHFRRRRWMTNIKWMCIYIYVNPIFQFIPPSSFRHLMSIHLFSMFVSLLLLCKYVHLYCFFSRFLRMYVNIWYLFFSFWLTSLHMTVSRSIHISASGQNHRVRKYLVWCQEPGSVGWGGSREGKWGISV